MDPEVLENRHGEHVERDNDVRPSSHPLTPEMPIMAVSRRHLLTTPGRIVGKQRTAFKDQGKRNPRRLSGRAGGFG